MYAFNGYIELCSCVCVCVVRFSTPYLHEEHSSVHRERERAGWLCRCYHHPLTRENTLCLLYLAQRWMTLTYILIGTDYCFHSYRRLYILFFDFRSIIIDVCEWCMCMWVCFCYSIQTMRRWKTIKCMFHYQFADWNTQDTHTRRKKNNPVLRLFLYTNRLWIAPIFHHFTPLTHKLTPQQYDFCTTTMRERRKKITQQKMLLLVVDKKSTK